MDDTTRPATAIKQPPWIVRWVLDATDALLRMERWLLTFAMCFLTALILLNVVTR